MASPVPDRLLTVGHVRRAHGLGGEVAVRLTTNRGERLDPGAVVYADGRRLIVRSSRPRGDNDHLVRFDDVATRDDAEALRGATLSAEPLDDPDELWVHELIGRRVVDQTGAARGVVVEVEANPASDLLVLEDGSLVPARFVVGVEGDAISVDVPEGLFEL